MLNSKLTSLVKNPSSAAAAFMSENNPFWDGNAGVRTMRKIAKDTAILPSDSDEVKQRKTKERIERAREAFVHIELSFKSIRDNMKIASAIPGMGSKIKQAEPLLNAFDNMVKRMKSDWKYAENVFTVFPKIADRYGCGVQEQTGEKRLPIDPARLLKDPLFTKMVRG